MKRFLLFAFDIGNSLGGIEDFKSDADTQEECIQMAVSDGWEYYQILDTQTGDRLLHDATKNNTTDIHTPKKL